MNRPPPSRRVPQFISFLMMVLWLFYSAPLRAFALNDEAVEYPAKLAFLYNFAKFIEWPNSYLQPGAPFVICIAGHDPFSPGAENELLTRTVSGHPIEIRTLRETDVLGICSILFIPITEKDQAGKILRELKAANTLTVGETGGFAARGGIINLTVEGNRLHFEINMRAAERAGLKISSKLFSLAKIVTDDPRSPPKTPSR
jgi:hypothetical protein